MRKAENRYFDLPEAVSVGRCPFINDLLPPCHCSDMRSLKVEDAIYYCGANHRKCGIYKMLKTGGKDVRFLSDSICGEGILS